MVRRNKGLNGMRVFFLRLHATNTLLRSFTHEPEDMLKDIKNIASHLSPFNNCVKLLSIVCSVRHFEHATRAIGTIDSP